MHARQQSEIAAWLALNSAAIIHGSQKVDGLVAASYWTNSKSRLTRWNEALKTFDHDIRNPDESHNPWPAIEVIVEEIVTSEMLTRIWSAVMLSLDATNGRNDLSGLAHSVFLGHMEARNRTLRLLLAGRAANERLFDRINQLRRSVEKWTDLFLSWIPNQAVSRKFAFDVTRFDDYVGEHDFYTDEQLLARHQVLIRSMNTMLVTQTSQWSANPELNRRIVDGILACMHRDTFDSAGLPKSLSQIWLERAHNDTQILIGQLESLDSGEPANRLN
jgi:hypothetical protein